ncbi:succinylglutamate desuccinylase/aspartoacylase family protein [Parasphingorhabdus cellanae]|uniref:Succinylglutamate desuccinylase/aspartoacylase family protein n=1 Tax=Parasphingorhabdus cellanae TaxID=2806553 RepID=A0ABX7T280_9SPHN|nr:succinylglutamate desuccinylase/aspartoacylase family protein [Parasphingorhabdus cellanae]QTD55669.1 succinylglutamate desuccinylase/aspartoacylase family protein [Parasphingorhabdus cellanae]
MTIRNKHDLFEIAGTTVAPGKIGDIAIPISDLSAGMQANLEVRVFHGKRKGPTIFVSAAIHGDEIIGTEIIRRVMKKLNASRMAGTVIFVPVVNMFGFITHSRYLPDRRDLNRSFPGTEKGSLASQLANIFSTEIIGHCSLGIDIHSAALHRYNLPQIRVASGNAELKALAMEFGAPVVIEAELRPGSLRALAREAGVDMLLMEAGEALRFDEFSVLTGVNGVLRVLRELDIIQTKRLGKRGAPSAQATRTAWLRSTRGGICRLTAPSGTQVRKGEIVAYVSDIFGDEEEAIASPVDGIVIGHSNLPVVNQGDALLHIAQVQKFSEVGDRLEKIEDAITSDQLLDEDEVI